MPELDADRLEVADAVRRQIAIENEFSRQQARSYVPCLQTTWDVPTIQWGEQETARQLTDARRLLHAAQIFRQIEGTISRRAIDCYRRAGEILEWLTRASDPVRSIVPIELLAAASYQLGGLPAMATGLLGQVKNQNDGVALYAAFLRADFDDVIRQAAAFWGANPELTRRDAAFRMAVPDPEELLGDDNRVVWYFTVELVRSLGLVADSLRRGRDERLEVALAKLAALDEMAVRTFSDDASMLISLMRLVAESYRAASIYRPLLQLAALDPDRRTRLETYARDQFQRGRGILWTSQLQGLERLLRDSSFALCTPTGSGKTLVANMALVKELLLQNDGVLAPLAIYLVPSRALAGEVEAKLRSELSNDMTITGLYGGADWGITDFWLTGDQPTVLIATVEKAEALMRYLGPILTARLRLLILDEAHQVVPESGENTRVSFAEHSNRSLRLESLVSRVMVQRPNVVRIALTAVAGGAAMPVARWVEGRPNAEPVGVNYRSTRQVIGVLETAPTSTGRILLDIMNGRPLYIRGQDQPVYLPLRMQPMPQLPAAMRNSLNRFNSLSVLWTALHLVEEGQRILISIAQEPEQTMRWFKEALELNSWANIPAFEQPVGTNRVRFDEARSACLDYCGAESFEFFLLGHGIATSHGQMPQRLRRLMTEMIDRRICPITVATATLTEGVNLPFDLIFLTSLKRRSWDHATQTQVISPLSTAEFRNLAGRAGRPGASKGIEGMTIIALPTQISSSAPRTMPTQRTQLRELQRDYDRLRVSLLIEERDAGNVESPLASLLAAIRERAFRVLGVAPGAFAAWLEQALPAAISDEAGEGATDAESRLADSLDELDGVLLTAIEELARAEEAEVSGAQAEAHLVDLWQRTFTSVAATQEVWLRQAFVTRGRAIVETVYTDAQERRRLYQYGFTPHIGRRFEAVAPRIRAIIENAANYGEDDATTRIDIFEEIGELLSGDQGFGFRVRQTETDRDLLRRWTEVLSWWMNELDAHMPEPDDLRAWQRFVADNLEFRLGVAIGAVVAQAWSAGAADPFAVPSLADWKATTGLPWFGFWARELLRWGTHDPFVAFALSQNLAQTRETAAARRQEFEEWLNEEYLVIEPEDLIDPQFFLRWQANLPQAETSGAVQQTDVAQLSGTDGRRQRYDVIPIVRGAQIRWLDAGGFELARSTVSGNQRVVRPVTNDFQLRVGPRSIAVHRTFPA